MPPAIEEVADEAVARDARILQQHISRLVEAVGRQQEAREGDEGVATPVAHDALGEEGEACRDERCAVCRHGQRELQRGEGERRQTGRHLHALGNVAL